MTRFMREAEKAGSGPLAGFDELHRWSIDRREDFWSLVWDFCGIVGDKGSRILVDGDRMPGASFFADARLNFAENLLRKRGQGDAIVFKGEDKASSRLSWDELRALVSRLQQAFTDVGVKPGDRIAAMMPNMPETVACMLAASSLGAIWSSCSPDFGEQGVLYRFGQIEPVIFIAPDGYWYNGNQNNVVGKVKAVLQKLPTVRKSIVVDYLGTAAQAVTDLPNAVTLADAIAPFVAREPEFVRLPFAHPLYILFSSGTTGIPKCIVHSAGGTLIQHVKEHRLHAGIVEDDRVFYFTTCGWMMWNWLVSALASGATLLLYDGSPFHPDGNVLFDFAQAERMTYFGTSAKFIDALRKSGLRPKNTHDLSTVRVVSSTGSPLAPEGFVYVYEGIKDDVHLASISGGTDIVSCFVLGVPVKPVWIGEIQGAGLGMAVGVWNDDGQPIVGEKGELVCTRAFPSMPVMF
jgi:acetoacetyl-CoA synthetase